MSTRDDGGPAFPVLFNDGGRMLRAQAGGMTLRDYFAAKVMAVYVAENYATARDMNDGCPWDSADVARFSYIIADAMLAERAK